MLKKISMLIITIFVSMILTFILIKLMPGDPVLKLANELVTGLGMPFDQANKLAISMLRYDPSVPVLIQIWNFIKEIFTGNLGTSIRLQVPVTSIIKSALPWTMLVALPATFLAFWVGNKIGILVAWQKNIRLTSFTNLVSSILGSVPDYIIGFFLIIIFAINNRWFPSRGAYDSSVEIGFNMAFIINILYHAVLPIMALFVVYLANWILTSRAVASNILSQHYIQYAKARGLSNKVIMNRYVGKNVILPLATSLATSFGFLLGGAPLIENLFAYPGVGYYLGSSIGQRDITLMQGMFFVILVSVIVCNFIVEILYGFFDPRLRVKRRK